MPKDKDPRSNASSGARRPSTSGSSSPGRSSSGAPKSSFAPRKPAAGSAGRKPYVKRDGAGSSSGVRKPFVKRDATGGSSDRKPYVKRDGAGGAAETRKPFVKRDATGSSDRKPYVKRDATGSSSGVRKPFVKRDATGGSPDRKPYVKRDGAGSSSGVRKPFVKRDATGSSDRKPYVKRDATGSSDRKPYVKRDATGGSSDRKPYVKRDATGSSDRKPYVKRDGAGGASETRKPYVKRDGPTSADRGDGARPAARPTRTFEQRVAARKAFPRELPQRKKFLADPAINTSGADKPIYEREIGPASQHAKWERVKELPKVAEKVSTRRSRGRLEERDLNQLAKQVGRARAEQLAKRLVDAEDAAVRGDDFEARRLARSVLRLAPMSNAATHIAGMASYRMGKWGEAAKDLEVLRLDGTADFNAILADCYRALKKWKLVEELWEEVRDVSPNADSVSEARIVMAGSLSDRGQLREAISLMEKSNKTTKRPQSRHLRSWYALADLYDKAGDIPRARELFQRVANNDVESSTDAGSRVRALA